MELQKKREEFRLKIRKQKNSQLYKARRNAYLNKLYDQQINLQRYWQILQTYTKPQQYLILQPQLIIASFTKLTNIIQQPSHHKDSLDYLDILINVLLSSKKQITDQMIDFFSSFIKRVTYRQLSKFKIFQKFIINILEVITYDVQTERSKILELKQQLLYWCFGTESITIIHNCIKQFLSVHNYKHIYDVIQNCFKSQNSHLNIQAAYTIIKITKHSDWDDTYQIYFKHNGIAVQILNKFNQCEQDSQTRCLYAEAIISLIDTYQKYIVDYAKAGVGLMACKLISSQNQKQNQQGLKILQILSSVSINLMHEYLLQDGQIFEWRLWSKLLKYKQSSSIDNAISFYRIISNMTCNSKFEGVQNLNCLLQFKLLKIADEGCRGQLTQIIKYSLNILQVLLYYAQSLKQTNNFNVIAVQIQNIGLVDQIRKIDRQYSFQSKIIDSTHNILKLYFQSE